MSSGGKKEVCASITELRRRAETWVPTWSFSDMLPKVKQGRRGGEGKGDGFRPHDQVILAC